MIATLDDDNLEGKDAGFLWQAEIARQFVLQRVADARRDARANPTKETREALKTAEEAAAEVCQGAHEYTKLQK